MLHSIQYSLIRHLDTRIPQLNDVVWMYEGVTLTGRQAPFATVENLYTAVEVLDKQYSYEADTITFQVSVYGTSESNCVKITDIVKKELHKTIAYFNTETAQVTGIIRANVTSIQAISPNGIEDETGLHRRHITLTVRHIEKL